MRPRSHVHVMNNLPPLKVYHWPGRGFYSRDNRRLSGCIWPHLAQYTLDLPLFSADSAPQRRRGCGGSERAGFAVPLQVAADSYRLQQWNTLVHIPRTQKNQPPIWKHPWLLVANLGADVIHLKIEKYQQRNEAGLRWRWRWWRRRR